MRRFLAPLAFVPFVAFTTWILADIGLIAFIKDALATVSGQQVFLDLILMGAMLALFMIRDAKERGVTVWPWLVLTLALGSIGPLAYFTYTGWFAGPFAVAETPT